MSSILDSRQEGHTLIKEGSVRMMLPNNKSSNNIQSDRQVVFYNPVQTQNRDLSVLMIRLYVERRFRASKLMQKTNELKQNNLCVEKSHEKILNYDITTNWRQEFRLHCESNGQDEEGITILDALAASGLRSLRYWKEIPGVKSIFVNDIDQDAINLAYKNILDNNLEEMLIDKNISAKLSINHSRGIRLHVGDAQQVLYSSRCQPNCTPKVTKPNRFQQSTQFTIIDLDPYGSSTTFLDAAIQAVENGGMLCVTCTDMIALGGAQPPLCYSRYGSMNISQIPYLHEFAIRILLYTLARDAARYRRSIKPIVSVGMHFYIRVFVEVYDNVNEISEISSMIGTVYQSTQCSSFHILSHGQEKKLINDRVNTECSSFNSLCEETGVPFKTAGPIWIGPLHDRVVVQHAIEYLEDNNDVNHLQYGTSSLQTKDNLHGLLTVLMEELQDVPLYYTLPDLCHNLRCTSPPRNILEAAIINAGYRVSRYHKEPQAIKTDAPNRIVWDIMRAWCKKNPPRQNNSKMKKDKYRSKNSRKQILAVEPSIEVDFTIPRDLQKKINTKFKRFPLNPQTNWGPKPKASRLKI